MTHAVLGEVLTNKHIGSRWPQNLKRHAEGVELTWHLHAKHTTKLTLRQRYIQMRAMEQEALLGHERSDLFAQCIEQYAQYHQHVQSLRANHKEHAESTLETTEEDIAVLAKADIIEQIPSTESTETFVQNIRLFCTPEGHKEPPRRRLVTHTPLFNTLFPAKDLDTKVTLPGPSTMQPRVAFFRFATRVDMRFFYAQFILEEQHRNAFIFRLNGQWWRLKTIPTGASNSAPIAHLFLSVFIAYIEAKMKPITVAGDGFVDNIRLLSNDRTNLKNAIIRMYAVANALDLDINEPMEEAMQQDWSKYTFLGVDYNHHDKTTSISEKQRKKLILIAEDPQVRGTLRQFLSQYGVLVFCSCITGSIRAERYWTTKFLRRRASARALLDGQADIWPSIIPQIKAWAESELRSSPRQWTVDQHYKAHAVLYTDASLTGCGAISFCDDGTVSILACRWTEKETAMHINILELRGFRFALEHLDLRRISIVHARIDNTSALYTLSRGAAKSWDMNEEIRLCALTQNFSKIRSLSYVKSEHNKSDIFSRMQWANDQTGSSNPPTRCSYAY